MQLVDQVTALLNTALAFHRQAGIARNQRAANAQALLAQARDYRLAALALDPQRRLPPWTVEQTKTPSMRDTHDELMTFYQDQLGEPDPHVVAVLANHPLGGRLFVLERPQDDAPGTLAEMQDDVVRALFEAGVDVVAFRAAPVPLNGASLLAVPGDPPMVVRTSVWKPWTTERIRLEVFVEGHRGEP